MSNINRSSFFLQWVAAVTVTMMLATWAAFISMWSVGELVAQSWGEAAGSIIAGGIFGALLGVGAGLGQAIVLRPHGIPFLHWLWQTALAGAVSMTLVFALMFSFFEVNNISEIGAGVIIALCAGLPIGLAQWQILKRHLAQAQWWILIITVAFLVGFTVGLPLGGEGREWLALSTTVLLMVVISGLGMVWLATGKPTAAVA